MNVCVCEIPYINKTYKLEKMCLIQHFKLLPKMLNYNLKFFTLYCRISKTISKTYVSLYFI